MPCYGVQVIFCLLPVTVGRQPGEKADKGLLGQVLGLLSVPTAADAVNQDIPILFSHKQIKGLLVPLLHPSDQDKIQVHTPPFRLLSFPLLYITTQPSKRIVHPHRKCSLSASSQMYIWHQKTPGPQPGPGVKNLCHTLFFLCPHSLPFPAAVPTPPGSSSPPG